MHALGKKILQQCTVSYSYRKRIAVIEPTKPVIYVKGLRAALKSIGATQSDQYSWIGRTDDSYVFTAEIDHIDKDNNQYNHKKGIFKKWVKPLSSSAGIAHETIRHSQELYDAVKHAHKESIKCRLLLVKGTIYGTTKGGVKAAVDGDRWIVIEYSGNINEGYGFTLVRTE